jgi:FkbH-like protein
MTAREDSAERPSHRSQLRELLRRAGEFVRGRPRLAKCDVVGRWTRVTSGRPIIDNRGRIELGSRTRLACEYGPIELRTEPGALLRVGSRTAINYATVLHAHRRVVIGDGVSIAPYCIISDAEAGSPPAPTDAEPVPVVIEDGAWLASRVVLRPGAVVGARSVITAGSIVDGVVPPDVVAGGIPARVLRHLDGAAPANVDDTAVSRPTATAPDEGGPGRPAESTAPVAAGLLISDFTIDPLALALQERSAPLAAEVAPFGAVVPTLLSPVADGHDFAVVWTQPATVLPSVRAASAYEAVEEATIIREVDEFADLIRRGLTEFRCVVVPTWTTRPWARGRGLVDTRPGGLTWALAVANGQLMRRLADVANVFVVDAARWIALAGTQAYSDRSYYLGKIPFSDDVFRHAADDIAAAVAAVAGAARKVVVVDLDNTLWGGVVGDLGWQQLRLGGHDAVGEAYVDFQHALKALTRRGVLLAIASKNEEVVALEAIDQHRSMVLARADFAAWRIDWADKAANLEALAVDLNLGLQSFVFIDDNPHERERVRTALPEVFVPEWPDDPTQYVRALDELTCFDTTAVTAEDLQRTAMYATEARRSELRTSAASLDEWIRQLEIVVSAEPLDAANLSRAAQLLNKTNQMNLRTRRLTAGELLEWASTTGHATWCVSVSDRLGDAGLTGLVSVAVDGSSAELVDFVLSCRVMGRKVEEAMVHLACELARRGGASRLVAEHLPTAKNEPCRRFFDGGPFVRDGSAYVVDLSNPPPAPADVTVAMPS